MFRVYDSRVATSRPQGLGFGIETCNAEFAKNGLSSGISAITLVSKISGKQRLEWFRV